MAAWRRRAIDAFPSLRHELNDPEYSLYSLFGDLVRAVREAFGSGDWGFLRAAFGFAEWCAVQPDKDLWNPAGVSFYEHLFDEPEPTMEQVVPCLSPRVRADCRGLWEWRLSADQFKRLDRLLMEIEYRPFD